MMNLKILVEEVGGALEHVCKVTTYLLDRAHREPFYNTVARHLQGVAPCGTELIVCGLAMADMLVEFDVVVPA
jgi:enamine deaminase RidA (YjgF/YER057c/UK114 family)